MCAQTYPAEPGCEALFSRISLGKRCLCSASEIARLMSLGDLKPIGDGRKASQYRSEDLDRIRGHHFEKIKAKYANLNGSERDRLAAQLSEMNSLQAGRTECNDEDRLVGKMAAEKMTTKNLSTATPPQESSESPRGITMQPTVTTKPDGTIVYTYGAPETSVQCFGARMDMQVRRFPKTDKSTSRK